MASKSKSISGTDSSSGTGSGNPSGLLEIATIGRAHGVSGEVAVYPITNRFERFEAGSELVTAAGRRGVVRARPDGRRWLVKFEGIDNRDAASALTGTTVFAEPLTDADELWVHELCGAMVVDQRGRSAGVVTAVVANPAADLLELDTGDLVPLTFVERCEPGVVYVEVPDGLFGLDHR